MNPSLWCRWRPGMRGRAHCANSFEPQDRNLTTISKVKLWVDTHISTATYSPAPARQCLRLMKLSKIRLTSQPQN